MTNEEVIGILENLQIICVLRFLNGRMFSQIIQEEIENIKKSKLDDNKISLKDPKTFDFCEAMRRVYEGKSVIPADWEDDSCCEISMENGELRFLCKDGHRTREIITKNDFEIKYKEVKEKPKTFGWDEAYRLMKEGRKISRNCSLFDDFYIYIVNNRIVSIRKRLRDDFPYYAINCLKIKQKELERGILYSINKEELDATDWYVYEE